MESCSNQKRVKQIKYILYLWIFKVATLCLGDGFAHSWHSLNQRHLECFSKVLKEFPHMLSTCWLLFLHSAVQLIPNHINWIEVGWLWRLGYLMQHSITLLLGQIAITQPGGVLVHCPVEKQMTVPLRSNQMGWRIMAGCCVSHAGKVCLVL